MALMIETEVLQVLTLAALGFIWTELRSMRKDLADSRERLSATEADVEQLKERLPFTLQRTK